MFWEIGPLLIWCKWSDKVLKRIFYLEIQNARMKPYFNCEFGIFLFWFSDTMKLYVKAHGSKSQNLIINLDQQAFLDPLKTLNDCGIENETEISFFKKSDYEKFAANPETKWE